MGCDVLEVAPLAAGEALEVEWEDGTRTTATFWADVASERNGHVLARIASGPWAGRPAVVETGWGKGRAYYVAARLDSAGLERVYGKTPALSAKPALVRAGQGIERVVRVSDGQSYEFLINHSAGEREVEIVPGGFDLLTASRLGTRVMLAPMGVAIVRYDGDQGLG